jgi:RIO-like serine/threonine protein kinase
MKPPKRLQTLIEEGLIDTVVRQLMSGKEAMVYVVRRGDETLCAKIYKEATNRSFRQAVDYTENRKVKNTRQARAMAKGSVTHLLSLRAKRKRRPGKAPKSMRCTAWPMPTCACPSRTTSLKASC